MMDIDGNGQVSYKELIETAKSSLEAAKKMNNESMPPEVLRVSQGDVLVRKLAEELIEKLVTISHTCASKDRKGCCPKQPHPIHFLPPINP